MTDLTELRASINQIDAQIISLFLQRMEVVEGVTAYKQAHGLPVYDRSRERENIRRATEAVPPELAGAAAILQTTLMEAARTAEHRDLGTHQDVTMRVRAALASQPPLFPREADVACQGTEGAYQQQAAAHLFARPNLRYYSSFEEVFAAVENGLCTFGILPLENSTAGSVTHVFDLMARHDVHIVRSCRLRIDHDLLVPPGVRLEDIHDVYSHPQALSQCADWLARLPGVRVHACDNTAMAAEKVARSDRRDVAAIASHDCARLYGLDVAERSIQDQSSNYTRFACIAKDLTIYPGADRSSLMVVTNHEPGALYKVLARFYALDINLLKLESRPIPGRDFEFMFYFDVSCPAAAPEFLTLLDSLGDVCEEYRYLGSYTEAL